MILVDHQFAICGVVFLVGNALTISILGMPLYLDYSQPMALFSAYRSACKVKLVIFTQHLRRDVGVLKRFMFTYSFLI